LSKDPSLRNEAKKKGPQVEEDSLSLIKTDIVYIENKINHG